MRRLNRALVARVYVMGDFFSRLFTYSYTDAWHVHIKRTFINNIIKWCRYMAGIWYLSYVKLVKSKLVFHDDNVRVQQPDLIDVIKQIRIYMVILMLISSLSNSYKVNVNYNAPSPEPISEVGSALKVWMRLCKTPFPSHPLPKPIPPSPVSSWFCWPFQGGLGVDCLQSSHRIQNFLKVVVHVITTDQCK